MLASRTWIVLVLLASACAEGDPSQLSSGLGSVSLSGSAGGDDSDSSSTAGSPTSTTTGDGTDALPTTSWSTDVTLTDATTGLTTTGLTTTTDPGTTTTTDATGGTTGEPPDPCAKLLTVTPGDVLNVRPTPSTAMAVIGTLPDGSVVDRIATVKGELIDGSDTWYQISGPWQEGYVFGAFVQCIAEMPPPPDDEGFYLPLECGTSTLITQGNFGDFSHQGTSAYAFDFSLAIGTPLVAIADGTVTKLYAETMPGDPCYDGGGEECNPYTNYVTLLHADGTGSVYAHLSAVQVTLGQAVARGSAVGLTGSTGWSTGPHAHVARQENCGAGFCQSIAVTFVDVPGDGVPDTGENVTSQNCP